MGKGFPYKIRELQLTDVPMVVELGRAAFTDETLPVLNRTWGETEVLNNYTGDAEFCLVAESRGKIIGFTLGTLMLPDPSQRNACAYGWLLWIAVSAKHQRNGVAAKLADKLARRFKEAGAGFILVNSDEGNSSATEFFGNNRFEPAARHIYFTRNL
jgi:ribosomal protein S18 acetylase RimI-like enzyme